MHYSRVTHTCLFCGSSFTIRKSQSEKGKGTYCSRPCRGAHRTRLLQEKHEQRFGMPIYDILHELYYNQEMPIRAIAKELNISTRTLWDWIADLNFPVRSRSDAVALQWKNNEARREQTAEVMRQNVTQYYANGGSNPTQRPDVRERIRLSKLGPKNGMYGKYGAQNPHWRGGKIDYRGGDWQRQRLKALQRDQYTCRRCGKTDCVLEVHHIKPFRVSHDNRLKNLLSLCQQCHHVVEMEWEHAHPVEQPRLRLF